MPELDLGHTLNWTEYSKMLAGLIAIMAIPAGISTFVSGTKNCTASQKNRIIFAVTVTVTVTFLIFTFFGQALLYIFGISIADFQVAGGILLLLNSLGMMNPSPGVKNKEGDDISDSVAVGVVPLAIPILAGPGAISTIVIYAHLHSSLGHLLLVSSVILSAALVTFIALKVAHPLAALMGKTGMNIFSRVSGLILAAIGIEFIFRGLATFIQNISYCGSNLQ